MATIASLNVAVRADTQQFEKAMRTVSSSISSAAASIPALAAAAATAAVAGLGKLTLESLEQIDTAAKLSDSLGINIQDLNALSYAASLAGSSSEEFADALKKQTKVIGSALQGEKSAIEALEQIGLSAENLAHMDAGQAFRQIADGINALPLPAQRAAAATDIFGKSATNLLSTISSGSGGLDTAAKRFESLAGSITREDAAKVEAANDAFGDLKTVLEGMGKTLAKELAPAMKQIAEYLQKNANEVRKGLPDAINYGITLKTWADNLDKININNPTKVLGWMTDAAKNLRTELAGVDLEMLRNAVGSVTRLDEAWQKMKASTAARQAKPMLEQSSQFSKYEQEVIKAQAQARKLAKQASEARGAAIAEEVATPYEKYATALDEVNALLGEGVITQETFIRKTQLLAKELSAATEPMEYLQATAAQKALGKSIFEEMQTPLEQFEKSIAEVEKLFLNGFLDKETLARKSQSLLESLRDSTRVDATTKGGGTFREFTSIAEVQGMAMQGPTIQKVESPQFAEAVKILQKINQNISKAPGATVQ